MTPDSLFAALWQDYTTRLCPSAHQIHQLLQEDEPLSNDHIALRTFNLSPVNLEVMAKPFVRLGYVSKGHYQFEQKS